MEKPYMVRNTALQLCVRSVTYVFVGKAVLFLHCAHLRLFWLARILVLFRLTRPK